MAPASLGVSELSVQGQSCPNRGSPVRSAAPASRVGCGSRPRFWNLKTGRGVWPPACQLLQVLPVSDPSLATRAAASHLGPEAGAFLSRRRAAGPGSVPCHRRMTR